MDEQYLTQRVGKANSVFWTLGHIVVGRLRLLTILGEDINIPWVHLFGRGTDELPDMDYPPIKDVMSRHREAGEILDGYLSTLTIEQLNMPALYDLPGSDGTLLGLINYFAFHETYHIGQIAVLRKSLLQGLPRRTIDRVLAASQ